MQKAISPRFVLFTILTFLAFLGQSQTITIRPNWILQNDNSTNNSIPNCSNCNYSSDEYHHPFIQKVIEGNCTFNVTNEHYSSCTASESRLVESLNLDFNKSIIKQPGTAKGQPYTILTINLFRKGANGGIEKLDSLSLSIQKVSSISNQKTSTTVSNSVLANGEWIKISIAENGIYKVDYNFLQKSSLIKNDINTSEVNIKRPFNI